MRRVSGICLLLLLSLLFYHPATAQVAISVTFGPPALPIYEQPPCPEDGWIWVPGYWAWDSDGDDYYWVPGTWVAAPEPGYLWTPPWWGWEGSAFLFHDGYWATEVGWYGGINYGFGYWGHGFWGGRWDHDRFYYNTAVVNVNTTIIRNVYVDKTVIVNNRVTNTHVSYNGGEGGIQERPTPREERVSQLHHFPPAQAQVQRRDMARSNPQFRATANHGKPPVAATERPTQFSGHGVVEARAPGAPYRPPAERKGARGGAMEPGGNKPGHARDLQPHQPAAAPQDVNPRDTQKYQQREQKLVQKQNQEHQKLEQKQQREDQRAQQKQWDQQRKQQLEQHHQQQTQQMEQRHQEQQQRVHPKPNQKPPS